MPLATRIESLMQDYVPQRIPCVALRVANATDTLYEGAWGYIDRDTQQHPTTTETFFDLASVTKLFVCTTFLGLVARGKIGLHDPLVKLIPEFATARGIDGGQDPHTKQPLPTPSDKHGQIVDPTQVTFWHLLTHTSGLPPWRDVFTVVSTPPPPPDQHDQWLSDRRERALQALCGYPFVSQPDGIVRYSDIGLMLLGFAITRLTGKPLEQAFEHNVHAHFATPLYRPMNAWTHAKPLLQTQIAPTELDTTWRKRRIWGEVHDENCAGIGGIAGHAGMFGNLEQVTGLGQMWLSNSLELPNELYTHTTTMQATTDNERRGLGWMIRSLQGSSAGDVLSTNTYGHTGFTGTSLFIDPDNQLVITLLTNAVYDGRDIMPSYEFRRAVHTIVGEELAQ
jgi:CubicO group peptidase (beta-lactamase class C family)